MTKQSDEPNLTFTAEVKKVESKKLASNDIGYTVILHTGDMSVLSLGTLDGDTLIKVTVEVEDASSI